ncbi:MAG: DUF177 domain-containing protein [Burkholderiales bacterium]|nr:DUF177 domain-containing protein [Burkholderiales bacterium]
MQRRPVIDGLEFARAGSTWFGAWPASDFPRLRDALHSDEGAIACELRGVPEVRGNPALHLRLNGVLQLTCQRCLEPLAFTVAVDATLLLARSQAQIDAEPFDAEGPEWIVADREMQLHLLVEDELLLALPLAPRHERCAGVRVGARERGRSPFAELREQVRAGRR